MLLAQPSNLPIMAEIHQVNRPNPHILELRRDNVKIVGEVKEQIGVVSHLEGRNKATSKALREEAKWIGTVTSIQSREADLVAILNNSRERNKLLMQEMDQQNKVILHLKSFYEGAGDQLKKHTTQMLSRIDRQAKLIFHLELRNKNIESQNNNLQLQNSNLKSQNNDQKRAMFTLNIEKGSAEYGCQGQLRTADSLEARLLKLKEVLNNQAQTMLAELDYQQELICELDPNHEEYFQPSHDTMVDMTENIEHWTSENNDDDEMTFEFETESDVSHEIISGLERIIDLQSMKLDHHENKIIEQKKIIFELKYQNGRLASELEAQTQRATCLLEMQNVQKEKEQREEKAVDKPKKQTTKKWHIEQICNAACKEEKEAMKREISNLNHRLRPLESNLLNFRQTQFCNYLKKSGSITAAEADAMLYLINQSDRSLPPTEADARMVQERLPQYASHFKRIYGVSPEKVLQSGK
jgi:hypothetical protein